MQKLSLYEWLYIFVAACGDHSFNYQRRYANSYPCNYRMDKIAKTAIKPGKTINRKISVRRISR